MKQFEHMVSLWINETMENNLLQSKTELLALREEMIGILDNIFNHLPEQTNLQQHKVLDHINADQITVEVVDQKTNLIFRRLLEVNFEENDNGLKLIGENFDGEPSEIVFLSNKSLAKILDLMGKGPDKERCDH